MGRWIYGWMDDVNDAIGELDRIDRMNRWMNGD